MTVSATWSASSSAGWPDASPGGAWSYVAEGTPHDASAFVSTAGEGRIVLDPKADTYRRAAYLGSMAAFGTGDGPLSVDVTFRQLVDPINADAYLYEAEVWCLLDTATLRGVVLRLIVTLNESGTGDTANWRMDVASLDGSGARTNLNFDPLPLWNAGETRAITLTIDTDPDGDQRVTATCAGATLEGFPAYTLGTAFFDPGAVGLGAVEGNTPSAGIGIPDDSAFREGVCFDNLLIGTAPAPRQRLYWIS